MQNLPSAVAMVSLEMLIVTNCDASLVFNITCRRIKQMFKPFMRFMYPETAEKLLQSLFRES